MTPRSRNKDWAKTAAVGVTNVAHKGGLLNRYADGGGILIGRNVMVAEECRGIMVAGDKVTAVLEMGMHLLTLDHFNRQPAAIVYTVSTEPVPISWFPRDTPYRRSGVFRVDEPTRFVERMVIRHNFEQSDDVVDFLAKRIDDTIPVGLWANATEPAQTSLISFLVQHGLAMDAFEEALGAKAPPPPPPPPKAT